MALMKQNGGVLDLLEYQMIFKVIVSRHRQQGRIFKIYYK